MKNKLFFLFCVVCTLPLWWSCSDTHLPAPIPDARSSKTLLELSIVDSMGNDVFKSIAFKPEEFEDTALSIKTKLHQGNGSTFSLLYFMMGGSSNGFPDTLKRKRLGFEIFDSIAYKKSDVAPFKRTYKLGVRIPQLFLDKEYRFIELSYVYDKRRATLLSATFEGQELLMKNVTPIEDGVRFSKGHAFVHLVYPPKTKGK